MKRFLTRIRIALALRLVKWLIPGEPNMAAIDNLNTAVANVQAYVAKLSAELAAADQSAAIDAAASAINSLVPATPEASVTEAPAA